MDCSFEDSDGTSTTCGWTSSSPIKSPYPYWDDWKPQNSGQSFKQVVSHISQDPQ